MATAAITETFETERRPMKMIVKLGWHGFEILTQILDRFRRKIPTQVIQSVLVSTTN